MLTLHLIYFPHGVVTHIVIEDSELKVHRNLARCVLSVRAGVNEVKADDYRVVKPDSTLTVPTPHGEVPCGHKAGG